MTPSPASGEAGQRILVGISVLFREKSVEEKAEPQKNGQDPASGEAG